MSIEQLHPNVTRERLYEGRIVAYQVIDGGHDITDAWADAVIADMLTWDRSQPYLSLQDVAHSGISPYGRQRTADITQTIPPDLQVYFAIYLGRNPFRQFINLLAHQTVSSVFGSQVTYRIFNAREDALAWLVDHLPQA